MKMNIIFASLLVLVSVGAYAQGGHQCTNATLSGDYGLIVTGFRPLGPSGPLEQFVGYALAPMTATAASPKRVTVMGRLAAISRETVLEHIPSTRIAPAQQRCN